MDNNLYSDLQQIAHLISEGTFYDDHDEASRLSGVLARYVEGLRTKDDARGA